MNKNNTLKTLHNESLGIKRDADNILAQILNEDGTINQDADLVDIGFAIDRLERHVDDLKQTLSNCDEY